MGKRQRSEATAATTTTTTSVRRSGRAKREVNYSDEVKLEEFVQVKSESTKPTTYSPPEDAPGTFKSALALPQMSSRRRNKSGCLVFEDAPEFTPNLTPAQMIRSGIFGGCYFNPSGGKKGVKYPRGGIPVSHKEYPAEWFDEVDESMYVSKRYDISTNKYGVKAGQDQQFWEEKGWINPQDPRGWFQWYTRFFLGRRTADDQRQISRWRGVAGAKGRWKRFLLNKIVAADAHVDDVTISPVVRQTMLHWAYEVNQEDIRRHLKLRK